MSLKIFIFTVYILQSIATWDNKVTRVCFINFEHIVYNVECKHFRIRHSRRSNRKRLFYSVASKPCENSSAIVKEEKKTVILSKNIISGGELFGMSLLNMDN